MSRLFSNQFKINADLVREIIAAVFIRWALGILPEGKLKDDISVSLLPVIKAEIEKAEREGIIKK